MDRPPSIGATIRELISYSSIVLVASFLCGTIWYIRNKFRHLMANPQILPQNLRATASRAYQNNLIRLNQLNYRRSSMRQESAVDVREPVDVNLPTGYHAHPVGLFKDDLPPSYTSLNFPSEEVKDSPISVEMEHPPAYRSIFFVSPPTPVEVT